MFPWNYCRNQSWNHRVPKSPDCHKMLTHMITTRSGCEYARTMVARTDNRPHVRGLCDGAACARLSFEWASGTCGYTPDTGALLGTLLCEDFCLFCTTPFTAVLGVLIEYKKSNKSLALRSKCSTFKESNRSASTVLSKIHLRRTSVFYMLV